MKTIKKWLLIILVPLLILGSLYGFFVFAKRVLATLNRLNSDLSVAIVAGCGTVLLTVLSALLQKYLERRAELSRALREKKVPIYEEVLEAFFSLIYRDKDPKPKSLEDIGEKLRRPLPGFIAWASDEVAISFAQLRAVSINHANENIIAYAFVNLMLIMRKDLGHSNKGLSHAILMQIFLNSPLSAKPSVTQSEKKVENLR